MKSFSTKIFKIGINPYVLIPVAVLNKLFSESGKNKGPIPVKGTLNGKEFVQTLVKYSGKWRLYLNTPMRKATGVDVGDMVTVELAFDPEPGSIPIHAKLQQAFTKNKSAAMAFKKLAPYRQKEIARYISFLKTEQSLERNVEKVIQYLLSNEPFWAALSRYKIKLHTNAVNYRFNVFREFKKYLRNRMVSYIFVTGLLH